MNIFADLIADFTAHVNTQTVLIGYLIIINLIGFISMGRDKRKAQLHMFRTPEAVLFLLALAGGSVGSILGMFLFHHKTRKIKFRLGMPAILALQLICILIFAASSSEIVFL